MSKKISITEQIEQLQEENAHLQGLQKLFEKAVKEEFGFSIKEVRMMIRAQLRYQQKRAAGQRSMQDQQSASEQNEE